MSRLNKIRIGFVIHVMQVAGAEVLVDRIIERLADYIEPTILCLDAVGTIGQRLQSAGVPVVVLNRKPGIDLAVAGRVANEVRDRNIQLIHAHQYTPFFYSAIARLLGAKVKILFTEHGRNYPDQVSWKRRWTNSMLLSRMADCATACCDFSARAIRQNDGFQHCEVLANGVPMERLPARQDERQQAQLRCRLGLEVDRQYVACVARFHPVKDHATLLRAWAKLSAASGDFQKNPHLLLVGDGEERSRCESLCSQLGISETVRFLGIRSDIPDILRAVDLFALTSLSEASSLTLLEAMACECPVVVSDVGGNGEHLTHDVEGFLVPRGDDHAIADSILKILADPRLGRRLGQAGRQRVLRHFDLDNAIAGYHRIYQRLVRP